MSNIYTKICIFNIYTEICISNRYSTKPWCSTRWTLLDLWQLLCGKRILKKRDAVCICHTKSGSNILRQAKNCKSTIFQHSTGMRLKKRKGKKIQWLVYSPWRPWLRPLSHSWSLSDWPGVGLRELGRVSFIEPPLKPVLSTLLWLGPESQMHPKSGG